VRVLVISDAHGNSVALKKILESEKYDSIWFLGDLTDYGPNPEEVLDILRDLRPEVWVSGNHDYANAFGVDCQCGEKTHELSVYTRERITQQRLSREDINFLRSLPTEKTMKIDGKEFIFVHACPRDPLYGYMFDFNPDCMISPLGIKIEADIIIYGHTHFPRNGMREGYRYFNPGSAGQPRDGDWRASYGIYDEGEFHLKRIEYDVEEVIKRIRALGLEKKHESRLISILREGRV